MAQPPTGFAPMCTNAAGRAQGGGDGAKSFLSLATNRLMARSSDYSYLSLRGGNHILKLPGFFKIQGLVWTHLTDVSKF